MWSRVIVFALAAVIVKTDDNLQKVRIDDYYQCLCPHCIKAYSQELVPVVEKLGPYLDVHTYPYGKANMTEEDGAIKFTCENGEPECYGDRLHACAIDQLVLPSRYVEFNGCMITRRSTDAAADECGKLFNVESKTIKDCAKSSLGDNLLKSYGEESNKVVFQHVPYVLVNGIVKDKEFPLIKAVCAAFKKPPKACETVQV